MAGVLIYSGADSVSPPQHTHIPVSTAHILINDLAPYP